MHLGFAAKPGELALGVVAMALLGRCAGIGQGDDAVKDGEGLTVAEGVERFDSTVASEQGSSFFDEAGIEHPRGAGIEAAVQRLAGRVEAEAQEAEAGEGIAAGLGTGFEDLRQGLAGGEADFEGTDELGVVVVVDAGRGLRIEPLKNAMQPAGIVTPLASG